MSYIGHLCTKCGHPDIWRIAEKNKARGVAARCPKRSCRCFCAPDPKPEVRPTFGLNSKPVERIVKPGEKITFGMPTCDCEACQELYADLTGAAA